MLEKAFYISTLIQKKLKAEISAEEEIELNEWLHQPENKKVFEELSDENWIKQELEKFNGYDAKKIKDKLKMKVEEENENKVHPLYPKVQRFNWKRVVGVAAAITIIIATATLLGLFTNKQGAHAPVAQKEIKADVPPGHDGAILTLGDGRKIVLDNVEDGKITDIAVKNGNKVSYQSNDLRKVEYNAMTTPRGRQFSLVLPDGTQVWLNAASSITYPTAFTGNERKVTITGEAYFEVAHNASKPFHVGVNGMDVQVLGTHFNINSYSDEPSMKTTLLQGSIKITVAGKSAFVRPGEQAQVSNKNIKLVSDADIDGVMAWKNGFFSFDNADINDVMKQLSRWYDVDVIYQGQPKDRFAGKIDRNLTLSQVVKGLAGTVNFKIEDGKKLIILP